MKVALDETAGQAEVCGVYLQVIELNGARNCSNLPSIPNVFLFYNLCNQYVKILISLRISGLVNLASVRLPTVVEGLQRRKQSKRRPEMTGQTPSDEKVSMEFQMFRRFLFKRFLQLDTSSPCGSSCVPLLV